MCGIVGLIGTAQASHEVHQALLMLQHRGQDSAGILSYSQDQKKFVLHKSLGQVADVFKPEQLQSLTGKMAIGHTRYSTIGDIKESDLQPLVFSHPVGLALVHNGNVSNYIDLKKKLLARKRSFTTDNDLEAILHIMSEAILNEQDTTAFQQLIRAAENVFQNAKGGYAVVGLYGDEGLFGYRDPHGIRPLVFGERVQLNGEVCYAFASETCALKFLGFTHIRDLHPGELIWVDNNREVHSQRISQKTYLPCMFEWIYFSSADSIMDQQSIYEVRLKLGQQLGRKIKSLLGENYFDVVIPVPDTSRSSALGAAEVLQIPYREGLIKNRYVQRSFILNGQSQRKLMVNMKFSVVESLVRGKRILLIDDSIVRGTTSQKLIQLLKSYGAISVTVGSSCPPIKHPCFYGIDFSTYEELIAANKTAAEVATSIGADQVIYTDVDDLKFALNHIQFCHSCLNGNYIYSQDTKENQRDNTNP